jgi:PAS domain S-box-containing protein
LGKDGKLYGRIWTFRDITERKKAEEELFLKTAFLEAQVNSSLDGILILDSEGKKVLQNQRMVDLWHVPREIADEADDDRQREWVIRQIKNPRQFAELIAHLGAHSEKISETEVELIDGRILERYSAPVVGRDGKHYGRIRTYRDITERKRAEARIAEQAAFLDEAREAIIVRDLEGKILFWNKGAERIYGWTSNEAIDRNVLEILHTNPKKFEKARDVTISQGEWHGELKHLTKDQREITSDIRCTLICDHEGHPKSILSITTDITEKKKIEAQYMRAQRMESIGTLAGGVAHDLNNILAPILMSIDILKSESDSPETTQILKTIEVSARRGADIVRQVLSFTRGMEGERIEVQPGHVLKDLENIIKDTFPKDIRLQFSIPNDMWTILGDPTQVHQVLLNLCVNARDAMPKGGTLTIGVENCVLDEQYVAMNSQAKVGRYVNISVTDSGTGMPSDILDKIFEPFFTTKKLHKGTGLGLSTVMAIVKSHEGIINVYSEPGKGTTFKVYLPAMELSPEARKALTGRVSLPRGNGETVLVVDDEASILTITNQTLQAFGYRVLTATDGADAMAVYAEHKNEIAVVITDMMMPLMDGSATIQALTRMNPAIKIIAVSGLNANSDATKEAGVKHFLTKPYTAGTLLKTLRAILAEA